MAQPRIVTLLTPLDYFPRLLDRVRSGYNDFDANVSDAGRVSVEGARAKVVNPPILDRPRLEFPTSETVPVVDRCDLSYLLVDGPEFSVGSRAKKLNRSCLSYNHRSGQQDDPQLTEQFFGQEQQTAHVILGYRMRSGLEPALTRVSLSSEYQDLNRRWQLRWVHPLWDEAGG